MIFYLKTNNLRAYWHHYLVPSVHFFLDEKTNQKNQGYQILFQMMGYPSENRSLLRSHHLIFEAGFKAKNEWISLWELTHFLNAFHPSPKTITFEGR